MWRHEGMLFVHTLTHAFRKRRRTSKREEEVEKKKKKKKITKDTNNSNRNENDSSMQSVKLYRQPSHIYAVVFIQHA